MVRKEGDADAAAHLSGSFAEIHGPRELGEELARHRLDRARLGEILEHGEELVAAQPRDEVARAQAGSQAARDLDQEAVAHGMAVRVVHLLEAVEVDEEGGEAAAPPARPLDRLVEGGREARAVGEAGERVAVGELNDLLARLHELGDLAADAPVADEASLPEPRLSAHDVVARAAARARAAELEIAERLVRIDGGA